MHSSSLTCISLLLLFAGRPDVVNGASADLLCGTDYVVPSPCLSARVRSSPLRVVYLDKQYTTQNHAAIAKVESLGLNYTFGKTCELQSTAVPEWWRKPCWPLFQDFNYDRVLQLRCRELEIWMDGAVHVGSLIQLFEFAKYWYSRHDHNKLHKRNWSQEPKFSLSRRVVIHSLCMGNPSWKCCEWK